MGEPHLKILDLKKKSRTFNHKEYQSSAKLGVFWFLPYKKLQVSKAQASGGSRLKGDK